MDNPWLKPTDLSRYKRLTAPTKTYKSLIPTAQPQHITPTPPPGLGLPRWPPNEDGHICDLNVFGRCRYCSWSGRMLNPVCNTHYDRPVESEPRYIDPGLYPPPNWPAECEWKAPYGVVERKYYPEGFARFDPGSIPWWSQWEILFARSEFNMTDADICLLYRYRWAEKDPSARFMLPHHVPEILNKLNDGHPWHKHAFWFQGKERESGARDEWRKLSNELRMAKDAEWRARCKEWEADMDERKVWGEEWKANIEALTKKKRDLEARTKMWDAARRQLETERWELAPTIAALREEFLNDLVRAEERVMYERGVMVRQ